MAGRAAAHRRGRSSTRCATRRPRSAFPRSTTSTAATTKAPTISRSTSGAAGAGARRAASSSRSSTAPNLRLVTGAHVERLIFEGRRAVGAATTHADGVSREARAGGEIVLAAGAIGTPQLLELSGVGRPEIVAALGREPRPRFARRRREPAGPSAIAHDLPHRGRAHAQRRIPLAVARAPAWRSTMRSAARADDHGAVAARHLRQELARLRHRQSRVPRPAAFARPLRRAFARLSRHHPQRLQPAGRRAAVRATRSAPIRAPRR